MKDYIMDIFQRKSFILKLFNMTSPGDSFWYLKFKACVRYFLTNFYLSRNDSPLKTMKAVFNFILKALFVLEIFKFLYFHLLLFFSLSIHCFRASSKINLKVYEIINCLNKNLIIHVVWYLEKKKRYVIETLSIDRVLNKDHFMEKSWRKCAPKVSPRPLFYFAKQPKTAIACKKFF